jgi:dTDP-glucose pyrophosphorylase/CBS domain-containing protein
MTPRPNADSRLKSVVVEPTISINEAIRRLDTAGTGALIVCSEGLQLLGLITDGDLRRAILSARNLEDPCVSICTRTPITATSPISPLDALRLMGMYDINQLPLISEDGIVCDLLLRQDMGDNERLPVGAAERLARVAISPDTSLTDAIGVLDKAGTGALVLCAEGRILCGVLTDGDIRRAILQGKSMLAPCIDIASQEPVSAPHKIRASEALELMNKRDIHHLPLVDEHNHVVDLVLRKDLVPEFRPDLSAVIMAGGYGKRLLPLTETVPKPMLPVGDRPLLELAIEQLRRCGIRDINLTTHYLPESIVNHFQDGARFGVALNYFKEEHPLGTAGGLKQMNRPNDTFLVINGDILTGAPFQEMLLYHRKHRAIMTVGLRKYDVQVPFGVVECDDVRITGLREKPSLNFMINAGTYLLEPAAYDYIPDGQRFDMTDLVQRLIGDGLTVVGFPIMEYWLDVGRHEDYEKAKADVLKGRI